MLIHNFNIAFKNNLLVFAFDILSAICLVVLLAKHAQRCLLHHFVGTNRVDGPLKDVPIEVVMPNSW